MVIVRIWEGLGNQFFQYAYARALKERGYDVRLDMSKGYDNTFLHAQNHSDRVMLLDRFNITLQKIDVEKQIRYRYLRRQSVLDDIIFLLAERAKWFYSFYEEEYQNFSYRSANPPRNAYIKGWFQNEKYFLGIRNILLQEFTLKSELCLESSLETALKTRECVSIHVRRGDYVRIGLALNEIYYDRALKYIKERVKNPLFLVFSDDISWVKENMDLDGECLFANENGVYDDCQELMIMSKCKHNVIANSTYSWWGAWLNQNDEKIVIAPGKWYTGQKDIVPRKWIIV